MDVTYSKKQYSFLNNVDAENAYSENILQAARLLEMVGYSISFASILVSIIIISAFR